MACAIELDRPGPFSPGNLVLGKVLCIFHSPEVIEGLKCRLIGQEKTNFTVENEEEVTLFYDRNIFLREEVQLIEEHTLQDGTYKYPFSFKLPASGIPSSFKAQYGTISYEIQAEVLRAGALRFYKCNQTINVSITVNLNDMLHEVTMAPTIYPINETLEGCCCTSPAQIFMEMTLQKDAFLVGEIIQIKLDVRNVSNMAVEMVTVALQSHVEFSAKEPKSKSIVTKEVLSKLTKFGPEANRQIEYSLNLQVPTHLNIPSVKKCLLFWQRYFITASVFVHECYNTVELPVEIKLGHIAVNRPRPIGMPQPSPECTGPSSLSISKNVVPIGKAPVDVYPSGNRPPYPLHDLNFPMPNVMPPLPLVHLPDSYRARPEAAASSSMSMPMPMPMPRTVPSPNINIHRSVPSAPFADGEDETLITRDGHDPKLPTPPPSYDDALKDSSFRK